MEIPHRKYLLGPAVTFVGSESRAGDCVAISSGGCCFPYRAVCSDQSRDDISTSQSYFYYEIAESAQWGWTLIAALAALLGVYLGGGLVLARRADGAGAPHPHAMRFRELQGMIRDGVRFAASAGKAGPRRGRGRAGQSGMPDAGVGSKRAESGDRAPSSSEPSDRKHRREKKEKSANAEKKGKREKKASEEESWDGEESLLRSESGGGGTVSTASGGGGRWIHVSTS